MGHFIIHIKENDDPLVYIQRAAEVVKEGGIIAYPTDTVYGIGADPLNLNAVRRVFDIKQRDIEKGFPILVPDLEDAMKIGEILPLEKELIDRFWPGAMTLVVPLKDSDIKLDKSITGGKETVAIRVPSNSIIRGICIQLKKLSGFGGIIGTSANFSGEPNITSGKRLAEIFSNILDFIIETGNCVEKIPSTVIMFDHTSSSPKSTLQILREGKITKSEILSVIKDSE